MTGAMQDPHLALRNEILERERGLMRSIFASGQDDGRTPDSGEMVCGLCCLEGVELTDDRVEISRRIAFGKHVGKIHRQRSVAERWAEVLERVIPAIIDTAFGVVLD